MNVDALVRAAPVPGGTVRRDRAIVHVPHMHTLALQTWWHRTKGKTLLPALAVQLRVHLMAARTVLNSHESRYSLPSLSNKVKTASNACLSVGFCFNLFKTLVRC